MGIFNKQIASIYHSEMITSDDCSVFSSITTNQRPAAALRFVKSGPAETMFGIITQKCQLSTLEVNTWKNMFFRMIGLCHENLKGCI